MEVLSLNTPTSYISCHNRISELEKRGITYLAMLGNDDLLSVDGLFDAVCREFGNMKAAAVSLSENHKYPQSLYPNPDTKAVPASITTIFCR